MTCSSTQVNHVCASHSSDLKECYTLTWYQHVLVHPTLQLCLRIIQQSSQRMLNCYLSFSNPTCFRKECLCFSSFSPTSGCRTQSVYGAGLIVMPAWLKEADSSCSCSILPQCHRHLTSTFFKSTEHQLATNARDVKHDFATSLEPTNHALHHL